MFKTEPLQNNIRLRPPTKKEQEIHQRLRDKKRRKREEFLDRKRNKVGLLTRSR